MSNFGETPKGRGGYCPGLRYLLLAVPVLRRVRCLVLNNIRLALVRAQVCRYRPIPRNIFGQKETRGAERSVVVAGHGFAGNVAEVCGTVERHALVEAANLFAEERLPG